MVFGCGGDQGLSRLSTEAGVLQTTARGEELRPGLALVVANVPYGTQARRIVLPRPSETGGCPSVRECRLVDEPSAPNAEVKRSEHRAPELTTYVGATRTVRPAIVRWRRRMPRGDV